MEKTNLSVYEGSFTRKTFTPNCLKQSIVLQGPRICKQRFKQETTLQAISKRKLQTFI